MLDVVDRHLLAFRDFVTASDGPWRGSGIVESYVVVMGQRLRATYAAMALLLTSGYHEVALPLYRRQLEDSVRLHHLSSNRDIADGLVIGLRRARELAVQRVLDRSVGQLEEGDPVRAELFAMSNVRKERVVRQAGVAGGGLSA